ncbi:hypothetical protein [Hyalangium sp.]|uniref:hypothetical protein n=1 Tax=Hyalangium sp. TaxID=2028555 RepID=UPI002D5333ED|nr:hypothetical protein [Hyalangium sp.]HYH98734.1 hypothetical protein [Hyalangium sp.]
MPSSAISSFIEPERVEALLAPWLPDAQDRAFVVRCMLGEGPAHHRGANYVLLTLLGRVLEHLPPLDSVPAPMGEPIEVPMRLPPHLAKASEPKSYPLRLPSQPLEQLAPRGSRPFEAMVDCLTDGPPQHALSNVAMVTLLTEILSRLERGGRT